MAKTTSPMTASRFSSILRTARLVLLLPSLPASSAPRSLSNFRSSRVRFLVLVSSAFMSFPPYSSLTRGSRTAVRISTRKLAMSTARTEKRAIIITSG